MQYTFAFQVTVDLTARFSVRFTTSENMSNHTQKQQNAQGKLHLTPEIAISLLVFAYAA